MPNKTASSQLELVYSSLDTAGEAVLVALVHLCLQELRKGESQTGYRGAPLLARLLGLVARREGVSPDPALPPVQGSRWRGELVREVCAMPWGQHRLPALAAMFLEVRLGEEELELVVTKMCASWEELPTQNLPPLVLQALLLSRPSPKAAALLLARLSQFFGSKLSLADRQNATNPDLVSMDSMDLISEGQTTEELLQAEGTVVYHLVQEARTGHPLAREVVRLVRAATQAPDLLLNPFSLLLSLALTSCRQLQTQLGEPLRQAMVRCLALEERRGESAWLRDVLPRLGDVSDLLTQIISGTKRGGCWDLVGQGLVDLGLALLDMLPGLGRRSRRLVALHNLGSRLLLKVVKRQKESARSVLEPLTARILESRREPQYTEALRVILREAATILMEQPALLTELVEQLPSLSHFSARRSLLALLPLVRLSRHLRDSLILVLRKALFSRTVATRQTAVVGVLLLLRTFKISTSLAVSQLSQSSGSLSSTFVDLHRGTAVATNSHDALCTELLGVLRRCFSLQPEVRLTLYSGLGDVVAKNPELCEAVLELVHGHWVGLVGERQVVDLGSTVGEEGVLEPAGWFLSCCQGLVSRGQQLLGEGAEGLERLATALEKMALHYAEVEVGDLGFDAGDNWDRKTAEGERRSLRLEVAVTVYEALLEWVVNHGGESEEERATLLLRLQQRHRALGELRQEAGNRSKNKGKKGKKGEKDKDGADKDKEVEEKGKDNAGGGKRGRPAASGDGPRKFEMPGLAISLKALSILVRGVLEDREPRRQAALTLLREDPAFPSWLLKLLAAKLDHLAANLASMGDEGPNSDILFRHLTTLAGSLLQHTVKEREQVEGAVLQGSQCLGQVLRLLLASFPRRRLALLDALSTEAPGAAAEDNLNPVLVPVLISVVQKIGVLMKEGEELEDSHATLAALVNVFAVLLPELDDQEGVGRVKELLPKLKNSMVGQPEEVLEPMVRLVFQLTANLKTTESMGLDVSRGLHSLTGDVVPGSQVEAGPADTPWLTRGSKDTVLEVLLEHLERQLDLGDTTVAWCKASAPTATSGAALGKAEVQVCILVAKQMNCCIELVKTSLPVGSAMDGLIKVLLKLFTVLDNLAKHFLARMARKVEGREVTGVVEAAKFDRMLKHMIDNQLTKRVYKLLTYMENKQNEREGQAAALRAAKKKTVDPAVARAKVLRETKYIPSLILKIELLDKNLIKLGKKMKLKHGLIGGGKLTEARDFRIKISEELERKLAGNDEEQEDDEEEDPEEDYDEEDSRLAPTGRSILEDVSNASNVVNSQESQVRASLLLVHYFTSYETYES